MHEQQHDKPHDHRVIIHLDLDCFYAQVEQQRLQLPREDPIAVQQWGSILAVNYPARKEGVKRGDYINDAKKKCPKIHLPHVETLGENRKPGELYDRTHQKAILRRYRVASAAIFKILLEFVPLCERASVDEAYLDVTEQAKSRLLELSSIPPNFCEDPANTDTLVCGINSKDDELDEDENSIGIASCRVFPVDEQEQLLCVGAAISREIRQAIFDRLGFTCSTGIGRNKLVAKLASPLNKPDGQAIFVPRFLEEFMKDFPIRKIRGLGGKLGKQVVAFYHSKNDEPTFNHAVVGGSAQGEDPQAELPAPTVGDLLSRFNLDQLIKHFGRESAMYIYALCNGDDGNEPVDGKKLEVKTFGSTKQFEKGKYLESRSELDYWIGLLCEEVVIRSEEELSENKRFPAGLWLYYTRIGGNPKTKRLSIAQDTTHPMLKRQCLQTLKQEIDNGSMFPCCSLVLQAKDFMHFGSNSAPISHFFAKEASNTNTEVDSCHTSSIARITSHAAIVKPQPKVSKPKISSFFSKMSASKRSYAEICDPGDNAVELCKENTQVMSFFCRQCLRNVEESQQEHDDFHFAQDLSRSQVIDARRDVSTGSYPVAKKSKANTSNKRGPMDAFLR